MQGLIVKCIW